MTCVVAIKDEDGILMAADRYAVAGHLITPRADTKLFVSRTSIGQPMLMGFTTSYRMGQLLRYWSPPGVSDPLEAYMATKFVDGVRKRLKEGGYSRVADNTESGGVFLVAVAGRVFEVNSDFQVGEPSLPYAAIGSGEQVALGALYATENGVLSTEARAVLAIEAAEQFITTVGGDVDVMRLGVVR